MTARRKARFDIREASGRIFAILGALLVVNAAVSVLIVRPEVARYRQLTDTTSPQAHTLQTREAAVVALETYRAALEKVRGDMRHFAGDVLATRQRRMIGVQLEIAKLLREFGIAFDRVQYENEVLENGALERFGIDVPLAGGYSSLRKFLQSVESSESFLVVERVTLGSGKSGDVVDLNITLATYFIAPDAKLDNIGKRVARPKERAS